MFLKESNGNLLTFSERIVKFSKKFNAEKSYFLANIA